MNEVWEDIGPLARRKRADNPGPMTLDGTNSYVLSAPGAAGVVVVDPGPLLEEHLAALAASGTVELILITHHHGDHTDGSARLHELTGAPVRAALEEFCQDDGPVAHGEVINAGGLNITVLATPGHTSDSVCYAVSATGAVSDDGEQLLLTGDTILGSGSTVICYPDGTLGDYLDSLEDLQLWARSHGTDSRPVQALPGHGPVLADLAAAAQGYTAHRKERLAQVRAAVEHLAQTNAQNPSAEAVTRLVYGDIPKNLQDAAQLSVRAQLHYVRGLES